MTMGAMMWAQAAGAAQGAADSATTMTNAGIGIGTGGEMTLVGILALALVGAAVAMFAGDAVRRRESARRPVEWGDG